MKEKQQSSYSSIFPVGQLEERRTFGVVLLDRHTVTVMAAGWCVDGEIKAGGR